MPERTFNARKQPTFRPSRTPSRPRALALPLAALGVVLVAVVAGVALSGRAAANAPAQVRTASASVPAHVARKAARVKRARKAAAAPVASATAQSSATIVTAARAKRASAAKSAARTLAVANSARRVASVASAPKTVPERMRTLLGGSTQLIVITGARIGSRSGTMRLFDENAGRWTRVFSATANFGANGLVDGTKRKEGHLQTPTGIWHIGSFLFGQHSSAPSGTKMRYRAITSRSWWSDQRDSTYNTWVESSAGVSGEHLQDATVQYEYAFDSGYNALPNERVIGRGTAIFIHCFEPAGNSLGKYTHGCIAISRSDMRRLFALLDPARHPTCAIGTLAAGTATSIYAY